MLKDGGRQPGNREERSLSASTVIARWQGNGEPCKSRGLRTVLWAAGGEIPPADPATPDGQQELELPSLAAGQREDWLGRWAMNQMLINVSTRRFRRSVRLPDGDVASIKGDGTSKSAVSRKFVALSSAKLKDWLASDLSSLDLLAIQIDGLHVQEDLILVAAVGIDATGEKHPLGLVEGATENAATVQALLDNLVARGLDPAVVRLFIIDGAKALSKAIRRTFGRNTPIQRCQVHKARNIAERLPKEAQAKVRKALRQAWEMEEGRAADPQPGAPAGQGVARHRRHHPGGTG